MKDLDIPSSKGEDKKTNERGMTYSGLIVTTKRDARIEKLLIQELPMITSILRKKSQTNENLSATSPTLHHIIPSAFLLTRFRCSLSLRPYGSHLVRQIELVIHPSWCSCLLLFELHSRNQNTPRVHHLILVSNLSTPNRRRPCHKTRLMTGAIYEPKVRGGR